MFTRAVDGLLYLAALLVCGCTVTAAESVPQAPPPPQAPPVTVFDRVPATAKARETAPPAVKTAPVVTTVYRQPVGHTHTCGRCGDVWDHAKNPGHACQNCGTQQWVQDSGYRPVPVRTVVQSPAVPTPQMSAVPGVRYDTPCASGNCPNRRP